jgi:hypothetical protein
VVAVMATLLLSVAGQYWWSADREARKGSVTLQFEDGLARGEIVGADGKPAVPPFTLPSLAPIELPGGWYRLRVTQPGRLSEDYELLIEQGRQRTFTVGCNDRQLWEPTPMPKFAFETEKLSGIVPVDGGALHISSGFRPREASGFVPIDAVIIKRLGKGDGNPFVPRDVWTLRLTPQDPALAPLGADAWYQLSHDLVSFVPVQHEPDEHQRPVRELIQPAPDLDGDGVGDLVFVCGPFVLAVSGKDGKVLWCRQLHSNLPLTKWRIWNWTWMYSSHPEDWDVTVPFLSASLARTAPGLTVPIPSWMYAESPTQLAGPPLVVADIDGDGHPDLIFTHGAFLFDWLSPQGVARPCVEAVSGRTGKTLWRHEAPNLAERLVLFKKCPHREEILKGEYRYLGSPCPIREFASLTEVRTDQGRTLLAGLYNEIERLDLLTGRPVAPPITYDLPNTAGVRLDWITGNPVAEDRTDRPEWRSVVAWSADGTMAFVREIDWQHIWIYQGISAIDTRSGEVLYREAQKGTSKLADLDGDGVPDIITASEVFDGATGKLRWRAGFSEQYGDKFDWSRLDFLPGPDFDGDGCRDVFSCMLVDGDRFGHPRGVKVLLAGLRSGKDGRPLWLTVELIPLDGLPSAGGVFYWRSAPGIAGHFVVNVTAGDKALAFFFAADTGRLAHVWPGLTVDGIADLDGDGLLDLYGRSGNQRVTVRGIPPEVWRRPGRWRWGATDDEININREKKFMDLEKKLPLYFTGPVPHADLDGDGVADVLRYAEDDKTEPILQAYSGRDGRPLWARPLSDYGKDLPYSEQLECLDLDGKKRPVVVLWSDYLDGTTNWAMLDGATGQLRWQKVFRGSRRADLLYRQPDGRLALVYQERDADKVTLVAIDADGTEVARALLPAKEGKEEAPLPAGFEAWEAPREKLPKELLGRFGNEWRYWDLERKERQRMLFPVGWGVDPSDSAWLRVYGIEDGRLTVLRKEVPLNPATEVPTHGYPAEVVLKRPLPWLERTRAAAKVSVGCVVAYLVLAAVLAAVGRRKTALFLLALLILLPAFAAAVGLVLVLAVLAAALPRMDRWWKTAGRIGLILVPGVLLAGLALRDVDPSRALTSRLWTYPVVLVPLIVLALAGWRKSALGLLVPCLLLLLYLNWPSDDSFKPPPKPVGGYQPRNPEPNWYLLDFERLVPPYEEHSWGSGAAAKHAGELATLLPHETWDWTGWYWLWPNQLASWSGPLTWAIVLTGAAEFVRRRIGKLL